nr:MAG TPA: hypothetical protein [Caudoviricetes sp.]
MLDIYTSEDILGRVSVQLIMTGDDWMQLKNSDAWKKVKKILSESETEKDVKEGGKTSTKKKIRKLEKRVASLETTVAQIQLESGKQLLEDVASDVKKNPSFKKLVGSRISLGRKADYEGEKGEACRR